MGLEAGKKPEQNGREMTRRRFLEAGASAAALAAIGFGSSAAEAKDPETVRQLPEGSIKVSVGVVTGILPSNFAGVRNLLLAIAETDDVSFYLNKDDLTNDDPYTEADFDGIVYLEYLKQPGEYKVARGMVDLVGLKSIHIDPRALNAFLNKKKNRLT